MIKKLVFILVVSFCFFSCKQDSFETVQNQVLIKFKNDPKNRKDGLFLLEKSKDEKHYTGNLYDRYLRILEKYSSNPLELEKQLSDFNKGTQEFVFESDFTNAFEYDFMENLNNVYKIRNRVSWSKTIDRHDYLNYILPYKINNSTPEKWRKEVQMDFGDKAFKFDSISKATVYLLKKASTMLGEFKIDSKIQLPDLPYSSLKKLRLGSCRELSNYTCYVLRSYAIPCYEDFTPNYTNIGSGHFWNAIKDESGKLKPFITPLSGDTLGYFKSDGYVIGKVYRKTFFKNVHTPAAVQGNQTFLPYVFNDARLEDVTDQYVKTYDVEISNNKVKKEASFAYLSVFNNEQWVPIAWGRTNVKSSSVKYDKVGWGSVYLPSFINDQGNTYIQNPFILREDGRVETKAPEKTNLISLKLLRKYPLLPWIRSLIVRMNGGIMQVANKEDFSDAVTIYKINNIEENEYYKEIDLNLNKKYQYFRYLCPPKSHGNVAEFEFYQGQDQIKGLVLGTNGYYPGYPEKTKDKIFDGDPLTYFDAAKPDGNWVGMKFDEPKKITKIRFLPRVAYNIIIPGEMYELFYWDNKWVSLGFQKASSQVLNYKDVPSNALYLLKNHSKGKEQRIFTYENGKQVWW